MPPSAAPVVIKVFAADPESADSEMYYQALQDSHLPVTTVTRHRLHDMNHAREDGPLEMLDMAGSHVQNVHGYEETISDIPKFHEIEVDIETPEDSTVEIAALKADLMAVQEAHRLVSEELEAITDVAERMRDELDLKEMSWHQIAEVLDICDVTEMSISDVAYEHVTDKLKALGWSKNALHNL